ncbi:hypothetical protein NA78x_003610 [Anatilimnocola sp. NA78]|uniref:hypothetical protein n=1 Tax=Anatilimnocola sp. NA78 TaxID=3415683 RepID=UPI003CE57B0D
MKTAQMLSLTGVAVLTLFAAAPARADHDHNHLSNISRMGGEIAGHARELRLLVIESSIHPREQREMLVDAAQLEQSARRLQSFARVGQISLVERELTVLRQTSRHFSDHAFSVGLGFSRAMRNELAAIDQDVRFVGRELASEFDHFAPRPVRPIGRPGFSIGGKGFSINLR